MRRSAAVRLSVLGLLVGAVMGLVFLGFEWAIKHGSEWVWNDLAGSDEHRWRVIPLALVLSIVFSAVLKLVREPRWTPPHLDPLGSADSSSDELPPAPPLSGLGVILLVGAGSLLAGASLGPEAPLVGFAVGLGALAAARADVGPAGRLLVLASAGALLVAFFGSLIPLAVPVLVLYQRQRAIRIAALVPVVLAGLAAWGMLWLVQGSSEGFGSIPSAPVHARDYAAALVLGAAAVGIGELLRYFVRRLADVTERIQDGAAWWLAAAVFGTVLGVLYLIGGESVQFSGQEGMAILAEREGEYGTWALAGIAFVKLLTTSWSLAAGYRGGLVFPSVFAGVAVSLFVASAFPDLAGPGVLLGSVAGLLVAMTSPALGVVMLFALLPVKLLPLGVAGAAGAIAARAVWDRRARPRAGTPAAA